MGWGHDLPPEHDEQRHDYVLAHAVATAAAAKLGVATPAGSANAHANGTGAYQYAIAGRVRRFLRIAERQRRLSAVAVGTTARRSRLALP